MRVRIANRRPHGLWWRIPLATALWLALAAPLAGAATAVLVLRRWARDLPAVPDLAGWQDLAPRTSRVVAADGSYLAELPFVDGKVVGHRTLARIDAYPRALLDAVLAAEDVRFARHRGVDYRAMARAAWANVRADRIAQGASTITQQVARNLLPLEIGSERSARRKVREALLARAIEDRWSKREILEVYLSFVFLGQGAYGMTAAARAYFDLPVGELDLPRAAMLAALIQAPSRIDPFKDRELAKAKRDEVLARMARAGMIDAAALAQASAAAVEVARPRAYRGSRVGWYTEAARQQIAAGYPEQLRRGGLVVETAALPALGAGLEADARAHAARWRDGDGPPQVGAIVLDHRTGYVEALAGGLAWSEQDQFDRVMHSCRQPGSAWKPLVFAAALEAGAITPGTPLRDAPIAAYDEASNTHWKPRSGERFRGIVLAQDAFAASLNAPAIDVFDRIGAAPVIALARRLGVTSPLAEVRPMALGASCVTPFELAAAYAVIARRGWAVTPRLVVRVRRGDQELFDASVPEDAWLDPARRLDRIAATAGLDPAARAGLPAGRWLREPVAFQITDMMRDVAQRGTATAARALGRDVAGKTGTTNDNTDAWFVGFTGRALAAVWVGFDDPRRKLGPQGDGARAALPLWMHAVRAAEGERPDLALTDHPPAELERVSIDRESGLLAAPGAPGASLWLQKGTAPTETAGQPGSSATDFGGASREF